MGDVITRVGNQKVSTVDELSVYLKQSTKSNVAFVVMRNGHVHYVGIDNPYL